MIKLTIQIMENNYIRLERSAKQAGKTIEAFINELIAQLPESEQPFDVTQDPIYKIEGYDSDAPEDLSVHIDKYLYGEETSK